MTDPIRDRAVKEAERLPCDPNCNQAADPMHYADDEWRDGHEIFCPAYYRKDVATSLEAAYRESEAETKRLTDYSAALEGMNSNQVLMIHKRDKRIAELEERLSMADATIAAVAHGTRRRETSDE